MKVLHIIAAYKPAYVYGGPTMSVSALCEALVKAKVTAEVFATTANGITELPVIANKPNLVDGVIVTYFKRITKDHTHFSPELLKAVRKRAHEFDVIHIHAWWNLVSVLSCYLALQKKIPVVLSPRGTLSGYSFLNRNQVKKNFIHNVIGKRLLKRCHIHVTSNREAEAVTPFDPLSITNIPNFVKLNHPANNGRAKHPYLNLLFFSRIEEKKGLDILLEALKMVSVAFKLTIAGNGDENYIEKLKSSVKDSHIASKIDWAGFYNDDKFDLLQRHDLMVLPSHDENFGNVVIESLSVGTPVLISENVGLADYVTDHNLGWICKTTPLSVSSAINNIANNLQGDRLRIETTAPDIIKKDFLSSNLIDKYINFYKTIL